MMDIQKKMEIWPKYGKSEGYGDFRKYGNFEKQNGKMEINFESMEILNRLK